MVVFDHTKRTARVKVLNSGILKVWKEEKMVYFQLPFDLNYWLCTNTTQQYNVMK